MVTCPAAGYVKSSTPGMNTHSKCCSVSVRVRQVHVGACRRWLDHTPVAARPISPAGLEELFRSFGAFTAPPDPHTLAGMAAEYHCDLDFEATFPIAGRHGPVF